MRIALLAILITTFFARSALAWEGTKQADGVLGEFLSSLVKTNRAIFVTECKIDDHVKAILVFRAGYTIGDFFIIRDQIRPGYAYATTVGQVSIEGGSPALNWTNAVPGDQELEGKLALGLTRYPFGFLPSGQAELILKEQATQVC